MRVDHFIGCVKYLSVRVGRYKQSVFTAVLIAATLLSSQPLQGQMCTPEPALFCEDAPVICNMTEVDGFTCANPVQANPFGPSPLCPGGGVPNNLSWWAFVSGGGEIEMRITTLNCSATLNPGIQAGIYAECSFQTPIACIADCFTGTRTLNGWTNACQTYYVFVDGCNGASCTYFIEILQGMDAPPAIAEPSLILPSTACVGEEICANASVADNCASDYLWTLNGMPANTTGPSWCGSFNSPGINILCVQAITGSERSICNISSENCQEISIEEIPIVRLPIREFCYEDRFGIFFTECAYPVPPIPGQYAHCCRVIEANGCIKEICQTYKIRPPVLPATETWYQCEKGNLSLPDGRNIDKCGTYEIKLPSGGINGCDSAYFIEVIFLDPVLTLEAPTCESDDYCINVSMDIPCADIIPGFVHYWTTEDGLDTIALNTSRICTDVPGMYCYTFKLELDDQPCVHRSLCVNIPLTSFVEWKGMDTICSGTVSRDIINYRAPQSPDRYVWSIQGGLIREVINDTVLIWEPDGSSLTTSLCCQAFLGECLLIDTCLVKNITSKPDPGFTWVQEGNDILLESKEGELLRSEWIVNGQVFNGMDLRFPAWKDKVFTVTHLVENLCDTARITARVVFDPGQAETDKNQEDILAIYPSPFQPEGTVMIESSQPGTYDYWIIDYTGRQISSGTMHMLQHVRQSVHFPASIPPGVYYLVVSDQKNGTFASRPFVKKAY